MANSYGGDFFYSNESIMGFPVNLSLINSTILLSKSDIIKNNEEFCSIIFKDNEKYSFIVKNKVDPYFKLDNLTRLSNSNIEQMCEEISFYNHLDDWMLSETKNITDICQNYFPFKLIKKDLNVSRVNWKKELVRYTPEEICDQNFKEDIDEEIKKIESKLDNLLMTSYAGESNLLILFKGYFDKHGLNAACKIKDVYPNTKIAIDQEGGKVVRLKLKDAVPISPSNAHKFTPEEIFDNAKAVSLSLREYCIDINLAPIADLFNRSMINKRDADSALRNRRFQDGMLANNVTPSVKHFPFYFDRNYNDKVDKNHSLITKELMDAEPQIVYEKHPNEILKNLQEISINENSMVMMSNNIYPDYSYYPAVFEPKFYDMLRTEVGFNGVIITDALEQFDFNDRLFLRAFILADIVLVTDLKRYRMLKAVIIRAYINGIVSESLIDAKLAKVVGLFEKNSRE